jgi:hypothetical protein
LLPISTVIGVWRSIDFNDRHLKSWIVNEVTNTLNTHRHYNKY